MPRNKVRYGLSNVHYAVITENDDGTLTYGQPIKWPGAVNLTREPQGDPAEFYADNGLYFNVATNNGYDGELEIALIPDEFRTQVLGEKNFGGVAVEDANTKEQHKFALLFQFEGDIKAIRHVLYYCTASRPNEEAATVEDTIEPGTSTLSFQARQRPDNHYVQGRCTESAPQEVYDGWYDEVFNNFSPTAVPGAPIIAVEAANGALNYAITPSAEGNSASSYKVLYKAEADTNWSSFTREDLQGTIEGLTNAVVYQVKAVAINSIGESAESAVVTGTPTDGSAA